MAENSKEPCWYVVHTYSGYENKVKDNIEKSVENNPEMQRLIFDVRVPVEDVVEIKGNKRVKSQRKVYPGYVLVHMIETSESWYLVRNTRGVTGFVGPGSEPIPLTDEEYERMTSCQGTIRIDLEPGDNVRIKSGSVENAIGTVEEINAEEHKVKVSIEILNRKTTVEYDISEVERL
ncbi:transcription termination/antitermination protein NusG [Senegalimassilia anaerobia]|uniref:transcription termination/antitermination protein NusG n=1 Tax=Senegalimassilia anaerobia TaxID=1473216 RepID=UPI003A9718C6